MAAPLIKCYVLPPGYDPTADSDIQQAFNDELLPFVDKQVVLANSFPTLTGVVQTVGSKCQPLDVTTGRNSFNLNPVNSTDQTPSGVSLSSVVVGPTGFYELRVLDVDNNVIPPSEYTIVVDGSSIPTAIRFPSSIASPSGATISCFQRASLPASNWALSHDSAYSGNNEAFNRVIIVADSGVPTATVTADSQDGYIHLPSAASAVRASFYWTTQVGQDWVGEYGNWIANHMNTWPDVFVSQEDYPGDINDAGIISGSPPVDPGPLPLFVDPADYRMNNRDGMVSFPAPVDSTITTAGLDNLVRANYAHLAGIRNVTGVVLDAVTGTGGLGFKVQSEKVWPDCHGKRLVNRNDAYMPTQIYVNNVPTPTVVFVAQEVMTARTGP